MPTTPIVACFPFVGDEVGGSHISAIKLIEAFDRRKVRPLVVLHEAGGELARFLDERGIAYEIAPQVPSIGQKPSGGGRIAAALRFVGATAKSAGPLARFLRERDVDLVHTNDGRIHVNWALPARLAGARQVWHHRGDPDAMGVNLLAPFLADHVVTVSRFASPNKPLRDLSGKLSVVHSPFDAPTVVGDRAAARAMLVETLGCAADTRFLGYFGLLIDRKRPLGFVDAVAAIVRRHPELPVMGLLYGVPGRETPDLDKAVLARAAELGISDRIRLMGFRSPVEPWMMATDVLLVPAVREPFGRTLIEAMFLETPVVATRHGGNPEAIEDGVTGFLVEPEDPEAFVEPVRRLLAEPGLRDAIAGEAHRRALQTYGIATHVDRITAIYDGLAGNRKVPDSKRRVADRRAVQ